MKSKKKNNDNLIHVIDFKNNKKINIMDNGTLCEFVNDKLASIDKRYLFLPNADSALYVLEGATS